MELQALPTQTDTTVALIYKIWFVVEYVCQLISFLRILCVEALCGENARRRMEKRNWKEDLRGAMLVANHNLEKLSTIFLFYEVHVLLVDYVCCKRGCIQFFFSAT
jgi:hypothetical protein